MSFQSHILIETEDGSLTCRDDESGELYHNKVGAYSEALHHYVEVCDIPARLQKQNAISVLDVCFGLGYNTFVFIDQLIRIVDSNKNDNEIVCHVTGIDRDPEILDVLSQVLSDSRFENLCQVLSLDAETIARIITNWKAGDIFKLQSKKLTIEIAIAIKDLRKEVLQLARSGKHYDYIFHDGFSPRSMPELWTVDLFTQYAKMLNPDGRIITYSAATAVRGGFKECGLEVRKSAPLGKKSGGTIAFHSGTEIADGLSILHLSGDENTRLNSRSAIPYRDPNLNNTRTQILQQRELEIKESVLPVYVRQDKY